VCWRGRKRMMGEQHSVGGRLYLCRKWLALDQAALDAAAPGTAGLSGVRMIGYFIDDAKSTSIFQLPSEGIECKAYFEQISDTKGGRTNSIKHRENCFSYLVLGGGAIYRGSIHASLSFFVLLISLAHHTEHKPYKAASASFCLVVAFFLKSNPTVFPYILFSFSCLYSLNPFSSCLLQVLLPRLVYDMP